MIEVCPPGCDQELYQKVCQLRERKTIEDSLLQESNKQLDGTILFILGDTQCFDFIFFLWAKRYITFVVIWPFSQPR